MTSSHGVQWGKGTRRIEKRRALETELFDARRNDLWEARSERKEAKA
jgi:hypothetical protein